MPNPEKGFWGKTGDSSEGSSQEHVDGRDNDAMIGSSMRKHLEHREDIEKLVKGVESVVSYYGASWKEDPKNAVAGLREIKELVLEYEHTTNTSLRL